MPEGKPPQSGSISSHSSGSLQSAVLQTDGGPRRLGVIDGELKTTVDGASDTEFIYSPIYGLPACSGRVGGSRQSGDRHAQKASRTVSGRGE